MKKPEFILLDACNFFDYPVGGTLSFARQMRKAFGNNIALAGIVTDDTPCGKWIEKRIDGVKYYFFGIGKIKATTSRPFVPERLLAYFFLKKHNNNLLKLNVRKIFTQTPQFMLTLKKSDWESVCFCFAGTGNSVSLSRYPFLRWLGGPYEKLLFKSIGKNADCILAAADEQEIQTTIRRSNGTLGLKSITSFPTRFDDSIFNIKDRNKCRKKVGINSKNIVIASIGRLSWVKGWQFVIQTFKNYLVHNPSAKLLFIGDGEDRHLIESKYSNLIESGSIIITGEVSPSRVSVFINCANLIFVGSYQEGWPTAMVEALACGKPIISTNVSGAQTMIIRGNNGEILFDRDPQNAADAIIEVLNYCNSEKVSTKLSQQFKLTSLPDNLEKVWLHNKR